LDKADEWATNVERWTVTRSGPYADRNYYLRVTGNQDPNDRATIEINSGGGKFDQREIVDAGFLELIRLGIKRPTDPLISKSLAVIDKLISVQTPHGPAWYRYNHDAYGERRNGGPYDAKSGKGRPWPVLSGERGQYELTLGNRIPARERLNSMMGFANDGRMIPEQIWDQPTSAPELVFGEGTGSATPLAWSMAQFIRLAVNLKAGRNLETPAVVFARYSKN
jgi:glucoamylase